MKGNKMKKKTNIYESNEVLNRALWETKVNRTNAFNFSLNCSYYMYYWIFQSMNPHSEIAVIFSFNKPLFSIQRSH